MVSQVCSSHNFLYFIDSGLSFRSSVGAEILPSHQQSLAVMNRSTEGNISHVDPHFFGGHPLQVLQLCHELDSSIWRDMSNGFLASGFENFYFNQHMQFKTILGIQAEQMFESIPN